MTTGPDPPVVAAVGDPLPDVGKAIPSFDEAAEHRPFDALPGGRPTADEDDDVLSTRRELAIGTAQQALGPGDHRRRTIRIADRDHFHARLLLGFGGLPRGVHLHHPDPSSFDVAEDVSITHPRPHQELPGVGEQGRVRCGRGRPVDAHDVGTRNGLQRRE